MGSEPGRSFYGSVYLFVADAEMGAQAYVACFAGCRKHAPLCQHLQEVLYPLDLDEHYVSLRRLDAVASVEEARGESAGVFVVFSEPVNVVLKGVEGGGGYDTGLAHAATERLTGPSRLLDGPFVSC